MNLPAQVVGKPVFVILLALASLKSSVFAQTGRHEFTGQRVVVSGVPSEEWQALEVRISAVESQSKQTYYAVIVNSTGNGANATVQYTDELYADWMRTAAKKNIALDPRRSVLVVLGIQNRQLSVHAGSELQRDYGLHGQTIDRQLVSPYFIPEAKAGNYVQGLSTLVDKIDEWIRKVDQQKEQAREQAAARAEQVRLNARTIVASRDKLLAEVQSLVEQYSKSGLNLAGQQAAAQQAYEQLGRIAGRIDSNGPQALKDATSAQSTLVSLANELRQIAITQLGAKQEVENAHKLGNQVAESIEAQRRAGLAVSVVGQQFDVCLAELMKAETATNSNPAMALQLAKTQSEQLTTLLQAVNKLPQQQQLVESRMAEAQQLQKQVAAKLKSAAAIGVDTSDHARKLKSTNDQIQVIAETSRSDYTAALSSLDTTLASLKSESERLQSATDKRYFNSRTLPMWIGGTIMGLSLLTLALMRVWHLVKRARVDSKLAEFKTTVVGVSDTLDELKERHRMLPFTDTDFKEPMTCQTLDTYNSVQDSIEELRQRWLTLMDVWQGVKENMKSEGFFSHAKLLDAAAMIDSAPVDNVLQLIEEKCTSTLDRLEDAHEQQQRAEANLVEALKRLEEQLQAVRSVNLDTRPYDVELRSALDRSDEMDNLRVSDPLGSSAVYDHVLKEVRRIGKWTEQVLHHHSGAQELAEKLSLAGKEAAEHRASGYRFCEEGSDPELLFPGIEHHRAECLNLLNTGEAKTAAEHLTQGFGLVASARERIERQVQGRAFCTAQSTQRPQEQERLQASINDGRRAIADLESSFRDESWSDVRDNIAMAERTLADSNRLLQEAARNGTDDVQLYITASSQYERVNHLQSESAALIAAVQQRLAELQSLRDRTRSELQQVSQYCSQVGRELASQTAYRPAANRRFQDGESALKQASDLALQAKVDWQDVLNKIYHANREFDTARSMAQEDVRLAAQAVREIASAEREVRSAASFYRHGFRADTSRATNEISQAQASLGPQDYERAIRMANQAAASAREALREAENRARDKQRSIERRQREKRDSAFSVGAGFGALSDGVSFGYSSFGSSGFDSSSSSGSFSSDSSSSSWSSGTSSSSW